MINFFSKSYALKVIHIDGSNDQETLERSKEAKLLSSLRSDYVVEYFGSFIENLSLNLLTEYCQVNIIKDVCLERILS